jgi:hypothetical protein
VFVCRIATLLPVSPGNTVFGLEALLEGFGVLICSVLGKHLATCGALEGLEARLALDAKGGGVLGGVSLRP